MTILTPPAVARLARISSDTVRRAIAAGKLPAAKHGDTYIVAQVDAVKWIDGRKRAMRVKLLKRAIERVKR